MEKKTLKPNLSEMRDSLCKDKEERDSEQHRQYIEGVLDMYNLAKKEDL